ncbi:ATP-dependent helicase [Lachnospiraceae bacterium MD1]|uniref:DNA 3'-5' helicase n=1 Tax=Variimorphobacter saccharofermentans TaxID=2755051 RepID=A0A839JV31_9FIRM|nr:ATP-dependent helicase [Variimorphobacter saccharofermentans]MBB2181503.1 ATP-dependent helicase [Variimorphobacter saccharofermentans]
MQMNQAQQQAVCHQDGPMLVLAGPGSGKTLVITERIKYLIEECNIAENEILVITFTKAAANEMKERYLKKRKTSHTGVNFGTFHAVFFTILKHAYHFTAGNIAREEIRFQFIKEILHRMSVEYEDEAEFCSDILSEISLIKGSRMELTNYYSISCPDELFRAIYQEYHNKLRRAKLIDFDDMLVLCYELFRGREDILQIWQKRFRYILIDEFQDINKIQYDIIRMLTSPENNLFIVGDDDQSIYRFRGAKPEIMLNFPLDYPDCRKVILDKNYRSTSNILTASNRLIQYNQNRYQKTNVSVKGNGNEIAIWHFNTLAEENKMLSEEIVKLHRTGIPYKEMAVLIRTTLGSGAMIHKIMEYNIPFRMKDKIPNIYDHWILTDLLAYIKIAMGHTDRSLYLQIINRPKRYISRDAFDQPNVDLDAVKDYYEDKNWMLERIDQLEYDLALINGMKPYAAINYIRRGIGYDDYLKEYCDNRRMKAEELIDILDEIQESAKGMKDVQEWFTYIENCREEIKRQAMENSMNDTDSVTIATMHSSKGLEFHTVFIVDANEGITPHKKAVLPEDLEEERRLFYVAMTRAKNSLYILSAKERYNKNLQWSRFIDEIKATEEKDIK